MTMTHCVAFESLRAEPDYLSLKFGTWKAYEANSGPFKKALQEYFTSGDQSHDVASQRDDLGQKQAFCRAIDACNGEIYHDWSGKVMTKEEAKKYVMEYK